MEAGAVGWWLGMEGLGLLKGCCWRCWLVWAAGGMASMVAGGVGVLGAVVGSLLTSSVFFATLKLFMISNDEILTLNDLDLNLFSLVLLPDFKKISLIIILVRFKNLFYFSWSNYFLNFMVDLSLCKKLNKLSINNLTNIIYQLK